MSQCLIITREIRELTNKLVGETEESTKTLIELWQQKNNKAPDEYPTAKELSIFRSEIRAANQTVSWARTSNNSYEVSSQGDKRFSALIATFKSGTIIEGQDVGGKTIEWVYQNVIKKSRKGKAPSRDSILFRQGNYTKEENEDYSYERGYLPLWQEWAKQNPELIEELRQKSAGKILTDKFANTRVSQARALAEILNATAPTSKQQEPTPTTSGDLSAFDTVITSVAEQEEVDRVFDPVTRRDRVTLIARLFSNEVDKAIDEYRENLREKMAEADPLTKMDLEQELSSLDRFAIVKKYTPGGLFYRIRDAFQSELDKSLDDSIAGILDQMRAEPDFGDYTEEENYESAKREALYRRQEYQTLTMLLPRMLL